MNKEPTPTREAGVRFRRTVLFCLFRRAAGFAVYRPDPVCVSGWILLCSIFGQDLRSERGLACAVAFFFCL